MKRTALVVDNFAGGGGASTGIEAAIGRPVDVAINHDAQAIAMHQANHPHTFHVQNDIWSVNPVEVTKGAPVRLAWFSPDCTHFSKAAGRVPRKQSIRDLAWVVIRWAGEVRPDVIMLENVEEFQTWGPLDAEGFPDRARSGETFAEWWRQLEGLGYAVERRELRAADYGAPTIRKRLFIIARRDGQPIVWPDVTHAKSPAVDLRPWRSAAECIDWHIPAPSIFERVRPLAEPTLRRIAAGIKRYVIEAEQPFIVQVGYREWDESRVKDPLQPFPTITGTNQHALVTPIVAGVGGRAGQSRPRSAAEPLATITAKADSVLVSPSIVRMNHDGAGKPADDVAHPLATVTTQHNKHQLVEAFLAKHFTGQVGAAVDAPLPTITTRNVTTQVVTAHMARHFGGMVGRDLREPSPTNLTKGAQNQLVTSNLVHLRGTGVPTSVEQPMRTVSAGGQHIAEVRALLLKFYGTNRVGQPLTDPMHTVTTKDRLGLVTIQGEDYVITDIGMRMLTPRELYRAQGFPEGYVIDPLFNGKPLPKTHQVRMCGNSVCPPVAEALVAANVGRLGQQSIWRGYETAAAG